MQEFACVCVHIRPIDGTVESAHFIQFSNFLKLLRIISPTRTLIGVYWATRVKHVERQSVPRSHFRLLSDSGWSEYVIGKCLDRALFCARRIEGEIWILWRYINLGRMVYQVDLEIISTVLNFLYIVQGEPSFMFARGVTSIACSVKRKGRKVFPN